jgi:hypothetical protein
VSLATLTGQMLLEPLRPRSSRPVVLTSVTDGDLDSRMTPTRTSSFKTSRRKDTTDSEQLVAIALSKDAQSNHVAVANDRVINYNLHTYFFRVINNRIILL